MKRMILSVAVIATMGFASCGVAESESESETNSKAEVDNGPSLCECVNMVDLTEECQDMKDDWMEKFEGATEEDKMSMQAEIEACETERPDDLGAEAALEAAQLEMEAALEEMSLDMDAVMEDATEEVDALLEDATEDLDAAIKKEMD